MKQALYAQLKQIKDDEMRIFAEKALDKAPEEFWKAPCSSSGKYHPPEDQGDGGIVRHLIKSAYISKDLCEFFDLNERDTDIVVTASILHDIKKNGEPWKESTDYTHGKIAYEWLNQFSLAYPKKEEIRNCVRYHMARWVQPEEELKRALNPNKKELIVQLTDYFCSRKCASFLPGIDVSEEDITKFLNDFKQEK